MRTTRPSTSLFALVCAVALVGGGVGEPFNLSGCAHHASALPTGVGHSSAHAGHAAAQSVQATGVDAGGEDAETDSHGPCLCIGACAGAGVVGVVSAGASNVIARAAATRSGSEPAAVDSVPARRTPYLLPYPTAPPRLG